MEWQNDELKLIMWFKFLIRNNDISYDCTIINERLFLLCTLGIILFDFLSLVVGWVCSNSHL